MATTSIFFCHFNGDTRKFLFKKNGEKGTKNETDTMRLLSLSTLVPKQPTLISFGICFWALSS